MRLMVVAMLFMGARVFGQVAPPANDCSNPELRATPTRPTVSFPAATTQCGVIEGEYGFAHSWQSGVDGNQWTGALRYGVTRYFEVRWDVNQLVTDDASGKTRYGVGDNNLLAKARVTDQHEYLPAIAVSYQVKVPTASPSKGLGTGYPDHLFTVLLSRDFEGGKYHIDQNDVFTLNGSAAGYQTNVLFTLAGSRNIGEHWQVTAEGWGQTSYAGNPGFASVLVGASYSVSKRTVFDIAVDNGVTRFAPDHRFIVGVTRALVRVRGR